MYYYWYYMCIYIYIYTHVRIRFFSIGSWGYFSLVSFSVPTPADGVVLRLPFLAGGYNTLQRADGALWPFTGICGEFIR